MDCFSDFWRVPCQGCIENSTIHCWKVLIATIRFCSLTQSLSSNTAMSTKSLILSSTVWLMELSLHTKKKILTKWFQIMSTSHTYRCELPGTIFSWNNKNSINKSIVCHYASGDCFHWTELLEYLMQFNKVRHEESISYNMSNNM
jgi:hypothetical protein